MRDVCVERLTRILFDHRAEVPIALRSVASRLATATGRGNGEAYQMVSLARVLDVTLSSWVEEDLQLKSEVAWLSDSWRTTMAGFCLEALKVIGLIEQWDATTYRTRSVLRVPWKEACAVRRQFEELRDCEPSNSVYVSIEQADVSLVELVNHRRGEARRMRVFSGWGGSIVVKAECIETFQVLSEKLADAFVLNEYDQIAADIAGNIDARSTHAEEAFLHQRKLTQIAVDGLGCLSINPDARRCTLDRLDEELRARCVTNGVRAPS